MLPDDARARPRLRAREEGSYETSHTAGSRQEGDRGVAVKASSDPLPEAIAYRVAASKKTGEFDRDLRFRGESLNDCMLPHPGKRF